MSENEEHREHTNAVLNEILDLVKDKQVSTIDFAEVTARVNILEDELKEVRSANAKLTDTVYVLSSKISAILDTNKKIENKLEHLVGDNAQFVTKKECNEYHKDIKSKAWIIVYPVITGIVLYAVSKIFGIVL